MSEYLFIIPITLALIVGVMSPGPSFLLVAQSAMAHSRKKALFISLGMGVGAMIFALVAASGVYILLQTSLTLFFILKTLGGLYLCYLAYLIFKHAKSPLKKNSLHVNKKESLFRFFLIGLFAQLANPKTAIVIGSIFAAFMPQNAPLIAYPLLGFIAFCLDAGWYSIVSLTLSTQKAQRAYLRYQSTINYIASLIIALIAMKLLLDFSIN